MSQQYRWHTGIVRSLVGAALCMVVLQTVFPALSLWRASVNAQSMSAALVTRSGRNLYLGGQRYQFTGVNAYELGTYHGGNLGCGAELSDQQLDSFFGSIPAYSMVRTWAFQGSLSTDANTKQVNWVYMDRVVNSATSHNIKLVLTIGDQGGNCDDNYWHGSGWYNSGYTTVINNSQGTTPLSYWAYMQQLVSHYAGNPTIAMWEPMNEPEASDCSNPQLGTGCYGSQTCPNEAAAMQALVNFFTAVGGKIHQLDPNHLVSSGLIGSGQCGASGSDYQTVNAVSGIDVASYHDYGSDSTPIPGDQYNGLQVRINQMASINKPLMVGEVGIRANGIASVCATSLDTRTSEMQNKLVAQFQQGIVGFMPWGWVPNPSTSGCSYDIGPGDPLLNMLQSHAFGFQTAAATNNSSGPTSGSSTQSGAGTTPAQHTTAPANAVAKSSGGGPSSAPKTIAYAPMRQHTNHTPATITSLLPRTSKRTIIITFIICGMAAGLMSFVLIKIHLLPRRFRTIPHLPKTVRRNAASPRTHLQRPKHAKKMHYHKLAT